MNRLNRGAAMVADVVLEAAHELNCEVHMLGAGESGTVIDCGVTAAGGLEAGRLLAEACLANLGRVSIQRGQLTGQDVIVSTDHPVSACMGSQYAGWQIAPEGSDGFFAMGSGPMRAAADREPIIKELSCREELGPVESVVGILETGSLPNEVVVQYVAERCRVDPAQVVLLCARTASLAGSVQVVARSVETALHKMHELKFDLGAVRSGFGAAPLPPVAKDDLQGIGWTNDAVLYGGEVTLWVECDDELIETIGPKIPSSASDDHGAPFAEIFKRYDGDFYKIDPHLFSPAVVRFQSLKTGRRFSFGRFDYDLLGRSYQLPANE